MKIFCFLRTCDGSCEYSKPQPGRSLLTAIHIASLVHRLLEQHTSQAFAMSYAIAERARKLGATTIKSIGNISKHQRLGHGRAVLAVGRHVLEIAYHLMAEATTYRELGTDYFDRYRAERLKRRSLEQLRRLGYQVTLTQLPTAA